MKPSNRSDRIIIRNVSPQVESGRAPIRRTVSEWVDVEAEIFTDGQDDITARVLFRHVRQDDWRSIRMEPLGNDRWRASFKVEMLGTYYYTIEASRREDPGLINDADRAGSDGVLLQNPDAAAAVSRLNVDNPVQVDPVLARFGAWYELFPRSCAPEPKRHGTLFDLAERLPLIADLGFDVVYLPPIHPIGKTARKGRNNVLSAEPGDPGSPWAIGDRSGGHKAVHPLLGTLEDFDALLARARELNLYIALDIALQCSPDHPYVQEHPEWFKRTPSGDIECASDPPNKYEDVYPFDFECDDWRSLWNELRDIFQFWIDRGVTVFRVDNPHTKPFNFWEWLIADLRRERPDLVFLAEGLTRPSLMTHLARVGFSQCYDYFPWRTTKSAIVEYYSRLAHSELREFFRPNLWPNTPQYLSPLLQHGGPTAFMIRFILAATLGSSYGIYGPAYDLCESLSVHRNSTEYADSEQYEIKCWSWNPDEPLRALYRSINRIRRANPALQSNDSLAFHEVHNDKLIAFSKTTGDFSNQILVVVSLDPYAAQTGFVSLSLDRMRLANVDDFAVSDLLTGETYRWRGRTNYVALEPSRPAHILKVSS